MLKKLLYQYISPKPNIVTKRFKFKKRKKDNQQVSYVIRTALKMSEFYKVGTHLDNALSDQMVWGASRIIIIKKVYCQK